MNIWLVFTFFFYAILLVEVARQSKSSLGILGIAIPFIILIATRSNLVPDTLSYINIYKSLFVNEFTEKEGLYEIGWLMLSRCIKLFAGDNHVVFFGAIATINIIITAFTARRLASQSNEIVCKRSFFIALFTVLYMAFFGLYYNAITLRAGLALSLLALATSYCVQIKNKKIDYLKIAFLVFVSGNMHVSATVFGIIVICLSLFTKQYSLKMYYILWGVVGMIYLGNLFGSWITEIFSKEQISSILSMDIFQDDFTKKMNYYSQDALVHRFAFDTSRTISFKFIFYWLSCLLFFHKIKKSPSLMVAKYLNIYLFGLILFAISHNILLIERVTDYFLLYSVCLFSFYLSNKKVYGRVANYYLILFAIISVQVIFALRIINKLL
jgi:hypothetical protein